MALLLNGAGAPEPSPSVTRRLRAIHPGLFLRHIPHAGPMWAVCLTWPDNEPRREHVRSGELPPDRAHDIIGYLPMDASLDEAPAYLEKMFRTYPSESVQRMADMVVQVQQSAVLSAAVDEALGEVLDRPDPSGVSRRRTRKS
jgi:hypothetical protein